MARITQGRLIRASNLAERRLLLSIGIVVLRVPRGTNPYVVARRLERAARQEGDDIARLRELAVAPIRPSREPFSS
jgi:hypothetical protein